MSDNPTNHNQDRIPTPEEFVTKAIADRMRAEILAWEKANGCSDDDLLHGNGVGRPLGITV